MASLSTSDFTTLVQNTVAAIQAGASTLLNLSVGSTLRAIVEARAAVDLWLQGLITYVLTLTRLATSTGSDVDTFLADYGFFRLPATAASGNVTFSRFTTTSQAIVPFGSVLQTADGTQSFTVNTDPTNPAYNLGLGGYVIAASVSSVTVSVTAVNLGAQGNVLAGSITSMGQGISGIDTVTNGAALTNGVNVESDTAVKARFVLYIASLSKATKTAIGSAIAGVQQGLQYTLTENYDYNGTYDPGFFYVVISNGSGSVSSQLLGSVGTAIEATRAVGIRYAVFAATIVTANVSMTITTGSSFNHATVVGLVGTALQNFINAVPLGANLPYTQLSSIAYSVAGVTNVSAILLNSGTSDLSATNQQQIQAGTITVA